MPKTGLVALRVQAFVFGAEVRLGKVRRAVRRVLARQAGEVAISDRGLGEGGQQPVAEKPAGRQVRTNRAARNRDRPDSIRRRCARGALRRRPLGRRLARRQPRRNRFPRHGGPRTDRGSPCGRGAAGQNHAHAADPPRFWRGGAATGSTCEERSTAISAMAACRSAWSSGSGKEKPLRLVMLLDASGLDEHVHRRVPALQSTAVLDEFREAERSCSTPGSLTCPTR